MEPRIDKSRIRDLLLELVRIDSHSRKERDVALRLEREMHALGADRVLTDYAGEQVGAKTGVVLDSDSPGFLFTRAPAANAIHVRVHGLEAHAGMAPEKGMNAIQIAAEAIASMRLGRIDDETTANLGVIRGGAAVNIVPKLVELRGEARSHRDDKLAAQTEHMRQRFEEAAARHGVTIDGQTVRARVEFEAIREYEAM